MFYAEKACRMYQTALHATNSVYCTVLGLSRTKRKDTTSNEGSYRVCAPEAQVAVEAAAAAAAAQPAARPSIL